MLEFENKVKLESVNEIRTIAKNLSGSQITNLKNEMLVGTTVVALKYSKGTVMAADMRVSFGTTVASEEFEKIFRVNNTLLGIAGSAAFAIILVNAFRYEVEIFEKPEGLQLSFKGKVNVLRQLMIPLQPLASQGMGVMPMLTSQQQVYVFDQSGAPFSTPYYAVGSGADKALPRIEDGWKPNLGREQAILLALKALEKAAKKDMPTGKNVTLYTIEKQVTQIPQEELENLKKGGNNG
ncbi:hypothetical protein MYX07_04380 [Patescibacteria group bacterium AH-259-L07]|nr:hypothetical protein [Patescibacteria group bacterium AH-259-L07]